ncbi:MAG: hypothetical protein GY725_25330 [bacterium]|nr:hypothetical protein [bacterium]
MRLFARLGLFALLLIVLLIGGIVIYFNNIARAGIEGGASHALGVETVLSSFRLRPIRGEIGLSGLDIKNPPGFERPSFMKLGSASASVDLQSLTSDVIVIPKIDLTGFEMTLEQNSGGSNYGTVLDNLEKLSPGGEPESETEPGAEKRVVIRELLIRDISAYTKFSRAGVSLPEIEFQVPEIRLTNLGEEGGGISIPEVMALVTQTVLRAVVKKSGALPLGLARDLTGRLDKLSAALPVHKVATTLGGTADKLGDTGRKAAEALGSGVEGVTSGTGKAVDKLKGFLGGKKEK